MELMKLRHIRFCPLSTTPHFPKYLSCLMFFSCASLSRVSWDSNENEQLGSSVLDHNDAYSRMMIRSPLWVIYIPTIWFNPVALSTLTHNANRGWNFKRYMQASVTKSPHTHTRVYLGCDSCPIASGSKSLQQRGEGLGAEWFHAFKFPINRKSFSSFAPFLLGVWKRLKRLTLPAH